MTIKGAFTVRWAAQDGTPGASAKSIYKNSFMKPSTPTGSSPSGWNNNHSEQAEINVQAQGDWYLTDDGFLTAPLIGNGQTSVETLSFITTQANQSVFLRLRCNTNNNDRVYIGNVDSVAPTTNYYREFHGSYQDSGDLSISVANAGLHFISIAYVRGSSGTSEFVKFICGSMYVWKSDALTFNTDGTVATWSTPYKISGKDAAFTTAVKTNLLLQSSFISTRMDKWVEKNGATAGGIEGRNCYTGTPDISVEYKELLKQSMYVPNGEKRLLANTWYTLSFWAKAPAYIQVNKNTTSIDYGFAQQICHFQEGVTNTVTFNGYCSSAARNAGKELRIFVYNEDWSWAVSAAITSTESSTESISFVVPATGEYLIRAYVYKSGGITPVSGETCTLTWYRINRGMRMVTYLYPDNSNSQTDDTCIDVSAGRIIDGIPTGSSSPTDNNVEWRLTEEWTKHTVTFKTRSYIPSKIHRFLVRMHQASNGISICMPKIEQGTVATDYCTNDSDIADFAADETGFPNDRNIWVDAPEDPYIWNEERRDYVAYEINGEWKRYFVKSKGMTVPNGVAPSAGGNDYWSEGSRINTLLVNTIVGANAELRFAKTNRLLVVKSDGSTVAAGIGGAENGDDDYPLWIGATYGNRNNAPFRVTLTGKLYATQANIVGKITGSLRNPFMLAYNQFDTFNKDNLAMFTESGSWSDVTLFSIPWDTEQSGRLLRLSSYMWETKNFPTSGFGVITAPTGKYFYENGRRFSKLYFSREMIELIGYGSSTTFYGWVVLNRVDFMTEKAYGMTNRCIMMGRINGRTTSDGTKVSGKGYRFDAKSYDATTVNLSRVSTGLYKLEIPISWKLTEDNIQVNVTSVGVSKNFTFITNASVNSFEFSGGYISAIRFLVRDEDGSVDGDLYFSIYNMEQFIQYMTSN